MLDGKNSQKKKLNENLGGFFRGTVLAVYGGSLDRFREGLRGGILQVISYISLEKKLW